MADTDQSTSQGPDLAPVDVLGVIQRTLTDLHGYCSQHPTRVDPQVCMQALERVAGFVGWLPPTQQMPAPQAGQAPAKGARAN